MCITYKNSIDNSWELGNMLWSGAKDRWDGATDEQRETVFERISECFSEDQIPTITEINDFIWFDCDDIFFLHEDEE